MIAVDTNVLVAGHRTDARFHQSAVAGLTRLAEGAAIWGIPWPCIHEFISVVTRPRMFDPPSSLAQAFDQIDLWMESPVLRLIGEGEQHLGHLRDLCEAGAISGPRVHDARIAAICLANGVRELWTADRDFSRFPLLRTRNPLV